MTHRVSQANAWQPKSEPLEPSEPSNTLFL